MLKNFMSLLIKFYKILLLKKKFWLYPLLLSLFLFILLGFLSNGYDFVPIIYSIF